MSRSILPPPLPDLHLEPSADYTGIQGGKIVAGLYQVGGVIGVGTYGEVRYAVTLATGERVAIKIVDLARFSVETAGLMRKEISILRMLNNPHCIRIIDVHENVPFTGKWCESCACTCFKRLDTSKTSAHATPMKAAPLGLNPNSVCATCSHSAGEHSSVNYPTDERYGQPEECDDTDEGETRQVLLLVQELAAGGELFSLLSHSGPLPEDVARYYFTQLMDGLEHCHELGISHRDIKPENLAFDESFQLKIVDFGLASLGTKLERFHPQTNTTLSITQQQQDHPRQPAEELRHYSGVGSQPYSAPECYYVRELYAGRGYRGAPADLWSSAVVLFVMLTGRPPFVRPLAKTYGAHLRRCKHFQVLIAGGGMDMLHPHAKDLLQKLLKIAPAERLTLAEVRKHAWMQGAIPSPEELCKLMEERSMKSWNQSNSEMTHVLSKMRMSQSLTSTPVFGALSPSASPAYSSLNSPAFSASSVPPSPYIQAQSGHGVRSHTPDSMTRSSPQGFLAHATPTLGALGQVHSHANSAFLPPHQGFGQPQTRHASINPPSYKTNSDGTVHQQTIASSIHSTGVIGSHLFPPTNLSVELRNVSLNAPEIPPPLPEEEPDPIPPSEKYEAKNNNTRAPSKKRLSPDHKELLSGKRAATLNRFTSFPVPNPSTDTSVPIPIATLPLASSFSFPPRSSLCTIRTSHDYGTLIDLLQQRLRKRQCRFEVSEQTNSPNKTSMTTAAAAPGNVLSESAVIECVAVFNGLTLVARITIRPNRSSSGAKGYLISCEKVKAGDSFTYSQWFDSLLTGLAD